MALTNGRYYLHSTNLLSTLLCCDDDHDVCVCVVLVLFVHSRFENKMHAILSMFHLKILFRLLLFSLAALRMLRIRSLVYYRVPHRMTTTATFMMRMAATTMARSTTTVFANDVQAQPIESGNRDNHIKTMNTFSAVSTIIHQGTYLITRWNTKKRNGSHWAIVAGLGCGNCQSKRCIRILASGPGLNH